MRTWGSGRCDRRYICRRAAQACHAASTPSATGPCTSAVPVEPPRGCRTARCLAERTAAAVASSSGLSAASKEHSTHSMPYRTSTFPCCNPCDSTPLDSGGGSTQRSMPRTAAPSRGGGPRPPAAASGSPSWATCCGATLAASCPSRVAPVHQWTEGCGSTGQGQAPRNEATRVGACSATRTSSCAWAGTVRACSPCSIRSTRFRPASWSLPAPSPPPLTWLLP
mmetsp:Transcript_21148/g.63633  ORF Transcript_21148/g.63633 Transcript_21148/m.63633 type:complete len:224 (+) Transcript_21148:66-737(+)